MISMQSTFQLIMGRKPQFVHMLTDTAPMNFKIKKMDLTRVPLIQETLDLLQISMAFPSLNEGSMILPKPGMVTNKIDLPPLAGIGMHVLNPPTYFGFFIEPKVFRW